MRVQLYPIVDSFINSRNGWVTAWHSNTGDYCLSLLSYSEWEGRLGGNIEHDLLKSPRLYFVICFY